MLQFWSSLIFFSTGCSLVINTIKLAASWPPFGGQSTHDIGGQLSLAASRLAFVARYKQINIGLGLDVKNRQPVLFHRLIATDWAEASVAPGGDEIARVDDFDIPEHQNRACQNRQPVLFHRHPGQRPVAVRAINRSNNTDTDTYIVSINDPSFQQSEGKILGYRHSDTLPRVAMKG